VQAHTEQAFGKLPLYFVENQGQLDGRVAYYIQGSDKTIYFTPDGVTFALTAPLTPSASLRAGPTFSPRESEFNSLRPHLGEGPGERVPQRWAVKLDFVNANPNARPIGQDKTEAVISYFKGQPDQWHAGLPTYASIIYPDLWPGTDLVYYGTVNQLKYEFIVHPGADPNQIRLAYRGATDVSLNAAGQMQVTTPLGGFADDTPVAYQDIDGQRVQVAMAYALQDEPITPSLRSGQALSESEGSLSRVSEILRPLGVQNDTLPASRSTLHGFQLGSYDPTRPLILDPAILVYCGYIGGSGQDSGNGIAVDGAGNAYVTGYTYSTEATFPVVGGPDLTFNGDYDAFVAKVRADGTGLVYAGYIGGADGDIGWGIAVDGTGNAYVTGNTDSTEATFPVVGGPDLTFNGGDDAFVVKVRADGTGLLYAGYIGGLMWDLGYGIAVDGAGNAYVTGDTQSTEATFPVTVGPDLTWNGGMCGFPPPYGDYYPCADAFVAKVRADGTSLVYAGYIGGSDTDSGHSIAVDGAGNAYITGDTESTEDTFPVVGGPDLTFNGDYDAFVAKVRADGTGLVYAGYIGGSGRDLGRSIAVDGAGNAYVTGDTDSTEATFPVVGGPDLTFNGGYPDVFVVKVQVDGTGLVYCGYIGGLMWDLGYGIAVDGAGNAYVTGDTNSTEATFPVVGGPNLTCNVGNPPHDFLCADAFVAKVRADGTSLLYAGYIGGLGVDYGSGIAVDGAGNAYVTGYTNSAEDTFPVVGGPDLTFNGGYYDAFVAKIATQFTILKQVAPSSARAVNFSDLLTYTVKIITPTNGALVFYDHVPTYTTYLTGSLNAPAGVAYDAPSNAISGTLNLMDSIPLTVSFAVRVEVSGTVDFSPLISNRACVHPVGSGLADCLWSNEVWSFTYVWATYLPLVLRNK
jgi:hypothetical protein